MFSASIVVAKRFDTTHTLPVKLFVLKSGIELVEVPVTVKFPVRVHLLDVSTGMVALFDASEWRFAEA
jgi:hypothetical protein